MLSHIRGLTASPRARYTLKWEVQISPADPHEQRPLIRASHQAAPHPNKHTTVERIYVRHEPTVARGEVVACGATVSSFRVASKMLYERGLALLAFTRQPGA